MKQLKAMPDLIAVDDSGHEYVGEIVGKSDEPQAKALFIDSGSILFGDGVAHNGPVNCRCYVEPLNASIIVLPDILETAVFGQKR